MNEKEALVQKAQASKWGYIHLPRGKVLCMYISAEQVVLVEPDGGYFYPLNERIDHCGMPGDVDLASALSGVPINTLEDIAQFCSEPRTMQEIEERFPRAEAWRLRHLALLKNTGRRDRKIVSHWVGYDPGRLVTAVFHMATIGSRKINS